MCKYFKENEIPISIHSSVRVSIGVMFLGSTFASEDPRISKLISGIGTLMLLMSITSLFTHRRITEKEPTILAPDTAINLLTN